MAEWEILYDELLEICKEITPYYDIDKIKTYSVYIWDKDTDLDNGENLFDIHADDIYMYDKSHVIKEESKPIIEKIQRKLKEIERNSL